MPAIIKRIGLAFGLFGALVAAQAAIVTGTFSLTVPDPGSEPLTTPFTGTFSFEATVVSPVLHSDGQLFNIRVIAAELSGGDEGSGCCYALNSVASQPDIVYEVDGDPFSLSLFFQNESLGTRVALGFAGPVSTPTLRWSEDRLNPAGSYTGIRGGTYTFDAPIVYAGSVPEPSTAALLTIAFLAYTSARPRRSQQQAR
jgi:hypothetical protein